MDKNREEINQTELKKDAEADAFFLMDKKICEWYTDKEEVRLYVKYFTDHLLKLSEELKNE